MNSPPRYGTPNIEYISTWLELDVDGPMWALNLMRYHAVAQYADGRESTISGIEADDLYEPTGPLAAVGARIILIAPVVHQLVGDGTQWDRVAIAQYPKRTSMIEMNNREDFQELHAHKDAGMASTIVMATFPLSGADVPDVVPSTEADDRMLLLQVASDAGADDAAAGLDAVPLARFEVEGVIVGDERHFAEVRYHVVSRSVGDELAARPMVSDPDSYVLLVDASLDRIAHSLTDTTKVLT